MNDYAGLDPFLDAQGRPRVLAGVNLILGSTRLAEMAGRMGFDVVWIDLEHASCDLARAEALCVAAEAGGAIPLVRTMGYHRDHVLRALEVGGRIVVAPMVNDADAAADLVRYGKYRPLGERGFYTRMRGQRFGLDTDCFARANASTVLMAQVETLESVRNLDAILAVEGLGGIFVGPGDLSAALGRPGDFANPELAGIIKDCLRRARATGRHAGVLPTTPTLIEASLEAGSDLCVFTSDINPVIQAWRTDLDGFRRRLSR